MAVVHVNGKPVDIGNERLNLIQAAEKAGVYIPRYCWHPALTVVASCRMCLVEAGECMLQDFSYRFGKAESRMIDVKHTPPNKPHIGANVTLFTDRCIMCTRCVRFTREISGEAELLVLNRGDHEEIDTFPGIPLDNKLATNVVDLSLIHI